MDSSANHIRGYRPVLAVLDEITEQGYCPDKFKALTEEIAIMTATSAEKVANDLLNLIDVFDHTIEAEEVDEAAIKAQNRLRSMQRGKSYGR